MSLLLDALRRAEDDSRKRKLSAAALAAAPAPAPVAASAANIAPAQPAPVPPRDLPRPELALQEQTLAPEADASRFPDLIMAAAEPSAVPNPGADLPSYARYARPGSAKTAHPHSSASMADSATAPSPVRQPEPAEAAKPAAARLEMAAPIAATTQRQALSAAGVLAGPSANKAPGKTQRRQWLLAAVALLLALPLAALLLYGDQFFGASGTVVAVNIPRAAAPLPVNPAVASPDSLPASPPEASATGSVTAAMPESTTAPVAAVAPAPVSAAVRDDPAPAQRSDVMAAVSRSRPVAAAAARDATAKRPSDSNGSREPAAAPENMAPLSLVASAAKPALGMEQAYAAYQAGQPDEATRLYRQVLQADPTQRDAWLGLAVIAHGRNQRQDAMDAYRRVLRLEPKNPTALAGLSSLARTADEPRQESKLRELLATSPQEADLNHALGLMLSGEKRWSEAQPLFFKAHALAPQEPQFAYNLAVALDHLRKPGLAVQYYETALRLVQGKAAGFDESRARSRLAVLKADSKEAAR